MSAPTTAPAVNVYTAVCPDGVTTRTRKSPRSYPFAVAVKVYPYGGTPEQAVWGIASFHGSRALAEATAASWGERAVERAVVETTRTEKAVRSAKNQATRCPGSNTYKWTRPAEFEDAPFYRGEVICDHCGKAVKQTRWQQTYAHKA